MTGWHALVPIKPAADRKTRLRVLLGAEEVEAIAEDMLRHVLAVLEQAPAIAAITLVCTARPLDWTGGWHPDPGGGLNAALDDAVRAHSERIVVVHGDLPELTTEDIASLLAAADASGSAIAPDRHDQGTNAVAVQDAVGLRFAFGTDSFARHRLLLPAAAIVRRAGLARDRDLPEDLGPSDSSARSD